MVDGTRKLSLKITLGWAYTFQQQETCSTVTQALPDYTVCTNALVIGQGLCKLGDMPLLASVHFVNTPEEK